MTGAALTAVRGARRLVGPAKKRKAVKRRSKAKKAVKRKTAAKRRPATKTVRRKKTCAAEEDSKAATLGVKPGNDERYFFE